MRLAGPSLALGIGLLAVAAPGAEGGAPLESTKQELRKLESGQKTGPAPGATDDLRGNLPVIHALSQEPPPLPPLTNPEKQEKERLREKEARKNWLVNGVEKLERESKDKANGVVPGDEVLPETESPTAQDSPDPQYLLKLYDEQKKTEQARLNDSKPQRSTQTDPLAPFLQGWLGNSPVRGQFFDEFVRNPAGETGPAAAGAVIRAPDANPAASSGGGGSPAGGMPVEAKPNPYLVDVGASGSTSPVPPAIPSPGSLTGLPPGGPVVMSPPIPAITPPPDLRPPDRKPPPAPLTDDKKYFPQLKRF